MYRYPARSSKAASGRILVLLLFFSVSRLPGKTITVRNINDRGAGWLRDTIASAASGGTIDFRVDYPVTITVLTPLTLGPIVDTAGSGGSVLAISGGKSALVFIMNSGAKVLISENGISLAAESRPGLGTLVAIGKGGSRSCNRALGT
jgi:hypothetical protein